MRSIQLILLEMRHRAVNAGLMILAVAVASALYAGLSTMGSAVDRETARIMRDMGFNIRIIPADADETRFWAVGYAEGTFPESYIERFMEHEGLVYARLMATLQERVTIDGHEFLLTGLAPEQYPPGQPPRQMHFQVEPGTTYLGHHAANRLGADVGGEVEVSGTTLRVEKILAEAGSADDVRIFTALDDAQTILGKADRINEIQAFECLCRDPNIKTVDLLRQQLAEVLPEAKLIQLGNISGAREQQRLMLERYLSTILPGALLVCAAWVAVLAMTNVRERRNEIGVLRALGYTSGRIALLFLGKAAVVGVAGAALGFAAGSFAAIAYGPDIFKITGTTIASDYGLLRYLLVAAPVLTMAAAAVPSVVAMTQDPAETLRET